MIIVLDTCAGVEISLGRGQAEKFKNWLNTADWVIAPDLYIAETANVYWKYHQFSELPLDIGEERLEDTLAMVDNYIPSLELYRAAWSFSVQAHCAVYDALFLVLARRENAHLLTADKLMMKMANKYSIRLLDGE